MALRPSCRVPGGQGSPADLSGPLEAPVLLPRSRTRTGNVKWLSHGHTGHDGGPGSACRRAPVWSAAARHLPHGLACSPVPPGPFPGGLRGLMCFHSLEPTQPGEGPSSGPLGSVWQAAALRFLNTHECAPAAAGRQAPCVHRVWDRDGGSSLNSPHRLHKQEAVTTSATSDS